MHWLNSVCTINGTDLRFYNWSKKTIIFVLTYVLNHTSLSIWQIHNKCRNSWRDSVGCIIKINWKGKKESTQKRRSIHGYILHNTNGLNLSDKQDSKFSINIFMALTKLKHHIHKKSSVFLKALVCYHGKINTYFIISVTHRMFTKIHSFN